MTAPPPEPPASVPSPANDPDHGHDDECVPRRQRYEIAVEGVLGPPCTAWFEGLQVSSEGNQTTITGQVADQAALHGLLDNLFGFGLVLISLRRLDGARTAPEGAKAEEP